MKPHRNKERVNGLEHLCVKRMEDSRIEASRMEALREKMIVLQFKDWKGVKASSSSLLPLNLHTRLCSWLDLGKICEVKGRVENPGAGKYMQSE